MLSGLEIEESFLAKRKTKAYRFQTVESMPPTLSSVPESPIVDTNIRQHDQHYEMLANHMPIPGLVIYLQVKLETPRKRLAKKKVSFEDRISYEYLEAVVNACEHFFQHYKSSDRLVIAKSETDLVDRSEGLQEVLERLSQPAKGTQYFLPLGSASAD